MKATNILNELKKYYDSDFLALQVAYHLININDNKKNKYISNFFNTTVEDKNITNKLLLADDLGILDVQNLLEDKIDSENKKENGVVYTPEYIVDYILDNTIDFANISNKNIIDPACGCGAFITGIINKLLKNSNIDIVDFINNHLYGIDINDDCKKDIELVINLQLFLAGICSDSVKPNIYVFDSLFSDWKEKIGVDFDYVVGNPPYVKVQNMKKDYMDKLKSNFITTKSGGFNLFYAFIEKSMSSLVDNGKLGFITPNNFLKIKSGADLRKYISDNKYLTKIIDFDYNMIFAPVMTYNAIMFFSKSVNDSFEYYVMDKTDNIEAMLRNASFNTMNIEDLENERWLLLSNEIKDKIAKIERFENKLGPQIKTGIATLRDKLYIIDKVKNGKYYKVFEGLEYEIEKDMIRPLYKVSDIEDAENITKNTKYIIFPYDSNRNQPKPLASNILKEKYPLTYNYFETIKHLLDERNKFKVKEYYEYGRSQGINNFGKKLMYSQFLGYPKFILCEDDLALICNGFAIYEDNRIKIEILRKIIQSSIMNFYIENTSYSIEGGFRCYQKKYLKNFSFPTFTTEQLCYLEKEENISNINKFLEKIYFETN